MMYLCMVQICYEQHENMKQSTTESISLWRNSLKLITSGTVVQCIAFLLLPLIGRLYTEEEIGILSLFLGIAGVLSIAVNARYDQAILVAPEKSHCQLLFSIAFRINVFFSILLYPLIFICFPWFSGTNYGSLEGYIWWLPVVVFLMGNYNLFTAYHNAEKCFNAMGTSQIIQGVVNNGGKVGLGFAQAGVWGLMGSYILGLLAGTFSLLRKIPIRRIRNLSTRNRRAVIAKHYINFPKNSIIQSMVNNLSGSVLVLMLPLKFSDKIVGVVAMAFLLTARPLGIVSDAISRVFCRKMIEMKKNQISVVQYLHRFLKHYAWIAAVFMLLIPRVAKPAVEIFLGPVWMSSSTVIIAMVGFLPCWFLSSVFNVIPDLLSKQRAFMYLQITLLLLQIGVILLGMKHLSFERFLWLYFGVRTADTLIQFGWFYFLLFKDERKSKTSIR